MASRILVTKRVFLSARNCFTQAWHLRRSPRPEWSKAEELRLEEGREIGERARKCFPGGVLVEDISIVEAVAKTSLLMNNSKASAIFEATFIAGDYVTKADVLIRTRSGWDVIEVKSNVNLKAELVEDLAYTVKVIEKCGIKLRKAKLWLLSPAFRLGMSDEDLFAEYMLTKEVRSIVDDFEDIWTDVPQQIKRAKPPKATLIWACRSCEYFETDCVGKDKPHPVFNLPYLKQDSFDRLQAEGIGTIAEIPESFRLSKTQERVRIAVQSCLPVIAHEKLSAMLARVNWPAYYLDFETVKTAIPLLPGFYPYETLVTQYSVHVRKSAKHATKHREYLADHGGDRRLELAKNLLSDLGPSGSIVVYSGYEKRVLSELATLFSELRNGLLACVDRLFDLQKVFTECYYHPEFAGSTSIKVTLPTLTDLTYDDLNVQSGDDASAIFARMMRGDFEPEELEEIRYSLLSYCKRDTLAMVRLHDAVLKQCAANKR